LTMFLAAADVETSCLFDTQRTAVVSVN
jgi:hypothetical protein